MSKCLECAKLQPTCCEGSEVGLTKGDITRISAYTGRHDFYHLQPVSERFWLIYDNPHHIRKDADVYVAYFYDEAGRRNILKKDAQDICCFLASGGCILPLNVRPIICRLFPYDWNDLGEVWLDMSCCPAELFKDEEEMKEHLCLPLEDAKRLVTLFYREIMQE